MNSPEIRLVALSYDEKALDKVIDVPVTDRVVTLGRDPGNDFWLEDSERIISRRQARVEPVAKGRFRLVNTSGTSPIFVNGDAVAPGQACELAVRDSIIIGRYALEVQAGASATKSQASGKAKPAGAGTEPRPAATRGDAPAPRLPDDFDVFAPPVAHDDAADLAVGDQMLDRFRNPGASLLDDLPGSDAAFPEASADGASTLIPAGGGAAAGETLDPLKLIDPGSDKPLLQTASDAVGEIDSLFALPTAGGPRPAAAAPPPTGADAAAPAAAPASSDAAIFAEFMSPGPGGAVVDEPPADAAAEAAAAARAATSRSGAPAPAPAPPAATSPPADEAATAVPVASAASGAAAAVDPAPVPEEPGAAVAAAAAEPALSADTPAPGTTLRAAFAAACGLELDAVPEFTPQFAAQLGEILAELLIGTLRLMHGRSVTKHELRANVTVITAQGNNPLKFAPDHTTALMQLLQPRFSGFMQPVESVRNAFDDLAAHQAGLLMGSRAAMYQIVGKLAPKKLEARAGKPPATAAIMPALRRAQLWAEYVEHYDALTGRAREEFESMFQVEFTRAYEAEIDRMWTARKG